MPKVKTYSPGQVQVGSVPTTTSRVQAPVDRTGEAMAKAGETISKIGSDWTQRFGEIKERKNKVAAQEAYLTFTDRVRERKSHYQSLQKKDADNSTRDAMTELDQLMADMEGELENGQQREIFRSLSISKRNAFLDNQATYEASQLRAREEAAARVQATEADQYATENYLHPERIQGAVKEKKAAVALVMKGAAAPDLKSAQETAVSDLHHQVVNRIMIDSAAKAKEYLQAHDKEIDSDDKKTNLLAKLENASVQQESLVLADSIVDKAMPLQEQIAYARKTIKDAKLEDATVQRLKVRDQEMKAFEVENRREILDNRTAQIIELHKSKGSYEAALEVARSAPNGSDQKALIGVARTLFTKSNAITYPDKFLEVMDRIDSPRTHSKGEIVTLQQLYREYMPFLSDSDLTRMTAYWKEGGVTGGLTGSRVKTVLAAISDIDPKEEPEKYKAVWDYVEQNLPPQKEPTDAIIKKLVSEALITGERDGNFWNKNIDYHEAVKKGETTWLPKVTADEEKQITKLLEEDREPVNDFMIRFFKLTHSSYMGQKPTKELREQYARVHESGE